MEFTKEQILESLKSVKHPETRQNIVEAGMVESLEIGKGKISFMLKFAKAIALQLMTISNLYLLQENGHGNQTTLVAPQKLEEL